jgi:hypothetical protein
LANPENETTAEQTRFKKGIEVSKMDDKEESCCSIDYQHHKEIFERRREAFLKDPEKAVTTHQAKIRLIKDHSRPRCGVMVSGFRFALFAVRTGADGSSGLRICTRKPAR